VIAEFHFNMKNGHGIVDFETVLADSYAYKVEGPIIEKWTFYDTFDWRLFNKSLILQQSGGDLLLRSLANGEVLSTSSPTPIKLARDLPDSVLKSRLQPIIKARALLKLAESRAYSSTYRILNKDEKTVARLIFTELFAIPDNNAPALAAYLILRPVRGYPKFARQLAKRLGKSEQTLSLISDGYRRTLEAAGQTPGSYSSKLNLRLQPKMRSDEATKIILRWLLKTMRANEAGIRADTDIEFLHDFRIAVRRTRSALSQIKGVFTDDVTRQSKGDFRALSKLSNDLRDLDVYLLAEPTYRSMLPKAIRDDVAPLFAYLYLKREQAFDEVITGLDSEQYRRLVADWEAYLNAPVVDGVDARNAAVPIINLARKRIYKKYCRIVKDGNEILEHTEDDLLHALRLECKKLRYLLEFFTSLFPPKEMSRLIKQLKRLQDNLGEFSDLTVQQEYLMAIAEELPINGKGGRKALVATGFLVETLARSQKVVKDEFAATFTRFASPANQKQYRQLFAVKGKRGKA
jgi:CHAD domain-containing protein